MEKQTITTLIKNNYKNWNKGDLILINAGTGTGKSYFIKNTLNQYAKENNKKILYLTNRSVLKEQVKSDIKEDSNITVLNYQKIESLILSKVKLDNYDYIVCDECHYFFTDAGFNNKTDLFLPKLLEDATVCKIFMTATANLFKNYLLKENYNITHTYELKTDYSYLKQVIAFNNRKSIETIIEDIPQDEQILLFTGAKQSYAIAKKYNGAFICSEYNKDGLYKYVKNTENETEKNRIIESGEFKNHLLCCTTCLDNGINIKENTPVKHIIIDILDRDEFIQCLGRKRVAEGEQVNLYFHSWKNSGHTLNGIRKTTKDTLKRADILLKEGEKIYIDKKFKNNSFIDGRIIDDYTDKNDILHKKINKCIYQKYWYDLALIESLFDKIYKTSFKNIIATSLNIDPNFITELEIKEECLTLEQTLDSIVGKKLFKEDRSNLIKYIGLKDGRGRLQKSIGQINEYLKANNLLFSIRSNIDWTRKLKDGSKNTHYGKTYWQIYKLTA